MSIFIPNLAKKKNFVFFRNWREAALILEKMKKSGHSWNPIFQKRCPIALSWKCTFFLTFLKTHFFRKSIKLGDKSVPPKKINEKNVIFTNFAKTLKSPCCSVFCRALSRCLCDYRQLGKFLEVFEKKVIFLVTFFAFFFAIFSHFFVFFCP